MLFSQGIYWHECSSRHYWRYSMKLIDHLMLLFFVSSRDFNGTESHSLHVLVVLQDTRWSWRISAKTSAWYWLAWRRWRKSRKIRRIVGAPRSTKGGAWRAGQLEKNNIGSEEVALISLLIVWLFEQHGKTGGVSPIECAAGEEACRSLSLSSI